jgi:DNA-binding response OmpR family regulator
MTRILVVEDDIDIRGLLTRGLEAEGFSVGTAGCVGDALASARNESPEAVVLDITLPDGSGHDVCRSLREAFGADDYIVKPFVFDELVARLRTHLLRRQAAEGPRTLINAGKLVLDLDTRQVTCGEASARLTPREAELLAMLMESVNRPVTRADIFERLWASQGGLSLNVVDVYVGYLRSKMADFVRHGGPLLVTVRGRGFMLDSRGPDYRH